MVLPKLHQLIWILIALMPMHIAQAFAKPASRIDDSLAWIKLSAEIETFLNNQLETKALKDSRSRTVSLRFDSLKRFVKTGHQWMDQQDSIVLKLLEGFDQSTGRLSNNPLFTDTAYRYGFYTYYDTFSKRFWFSKLTKEHQDEIKQQLFVTYELYAEAPGGMVRFLDSLVAQLRKYTGINQYLEKDSMVLSFIADTAWQQVRNRIKVNGSPNEAIAQMVINQGEWSPAIFCGHPVPTHLQITFYKWLWDAPATVAPWPYTNTQSMVMFFPDIPHAEQVNVYPYQPTPHPSGNLLMVSFLLKNREPIMHAPVVLQGREAQGQQLLQLIESHLPSSPLLCTPNPRRVYITYPAQKLPRY